MKIIISHDVDSISVGEHYKDLILPKFLVRGFIELGLGYISVSEVFHRFKDILKNKWQNLDELINFNKVQKIPATFFIGVANGLGLKYSQKSAKFWITKIAQEGFELGVHGIAHDKFNDIQKEYLRFKNNAGCDTFGIRMHYLRCNQKTLNSLNICGYSFDSTVFEMKNPYKIGNMWEFPLHIMDARIIETNNKWQNVKIEHSKESTKRLLDEAYENNINYLSVLFHDMYFSPSFKTWKEWYIWLINYLKDNNFSFINYNDAMKELELNNAVISTDKILKIY